jgi:hypothetical protein
MIKRRKVIGIGSVAGKSIEIALTSNVWLGEGTNRTMSKSISIPFINHYFGKHPILRFGMPHFRGFYALYF